MIQHLIQSPPSTTAIIAHAVLRAAAARGIAIAADDAMGLEATSPPAFEARVPLAGVHRLWENVMRAGAPATLPWDAARVPLSEMKSPVSFLCTSSETVGDAVDQLIAYWPLVTTAARWIKEPRTDGVLLRLEAPPPRTLGERCHVEYEILDLAHTAAVAAGSAVPLGVVTFAHEAPTASSLAYREALGPFVRFGAREVTIALSSAALATRFRTAAAGLATILETHSRGMLERTVSHGTLMERLHGAVRTSLRAGAAPRLEDIASDLGLGPRTLLRRLRAEGTSFQTELDRIRCELATHLLSAGDVGHKQVAHAVGFSDARAFARAFRRWTGGTPTRFRRSARGDA
jgi:AraC-like DNA-binding protein